MANLLKEKANQGIYFLVVLIFLNVSILSLWKKQMIITSLTLLLFGNKHEKIRKRYDNRLSATTLEK
jgi:hypothetical protein